MNNIRSMQQLRLERSKLDQRKLELEKAIRQEWGYIKHKARSIETVGQLYHQFSVCGNKDGEAAGTKSFLGLAGRYIKKWLSKEEGRKKSWFQ